MRKGGVFSRVLGFAFACLMVGSAFGGSTCAASATSPPTVPTSDWHNYQGGKISWRVTSGGIEINYPGEFLGYPRSSTQGSEDALAAVARQTWEKYRDLFVEAAETYQVPPIMLLAIATTESSGNADKLGGLMQTNTYKGEKVSAKDSIMDAARWWLGPSYKRYKGDPIFQAVAYNAGELYQSSRYVRPEGGWHGDNAWNMRMVSSDGTHYGSYAWKFAANFNTAVPIVGTSHLPLGAYYTLTLRAWTESGHQTLRARVEVNYRKPNGQWVEYESHWTTDMIQVARDTRAYVYLKEDPSGYAGQFLFWDNYGIARGPPSDRNWYLDMNDDRTMAATYRDISTPTLERGDYPDAQWIPAHGDHYTLANRRSIEYVVIHAMFGHFGDPNNPDASGTIRWFRLSLADRRKEDPNAARSSAHYLISKDGKVVQMVKEKDIAFHAGNEVYNHNSVGIELEDKLKYLTQPWATEEMYQASAKLVKYLTEKYNIPRDRSHIIGHSEVPGAGKKDPGPYWNWDYFMDLVKGVTTKAERTTIPFEGMYAVYEVEQSWSDPLHGRWSYRGTLKYTIDRVFGTFCDITYLMKGAIYADSRKIQDVDLPSAQVSNFPADKDTLFYLLPTTDPAKNTPTSIHMIPYMGVSARLDYKGTQMIKVPRGSFNCYRLEGSVDDVIGLYVHLWAEPGEVTLYYDVNSKLLIYLYKKSKSFESKLSLKDTNVPLTPQRCLIATATYGSEFSPEVQFLRVFRDDIVLSTFSGNSFMKVFNSWYYSFSPSVAEFISEHNAAKEMTRGTLYPFIGILHLSLELYSILRFDPEIAVITAGLVASFLIGIFYLSIPMVLLSWSVARRRNFTSRYKQ